MILRQPEEEADRPKRRKLELMIANNCGETAR